MSLAFSVTYDYRCPFARTAHEHVVTGLKHGADWTVHFVPFSLRQIHVEEGEPDVWDEPEKDTGLLALQAGIVVRDHFPDRFLDVHIGLFSARHDAGQAIADPDVVKRVLEENDVDSGAVFERIARGEALATIKAEHTAAVTDHNVWGVPTFVADGQAVFVRLMERPAGRGELAISTIERLLDLVIGWPQLNEFKHTSIPR